MTQLDTLTPSHENTDERLYRSPFCDQIAVQDTIACEECGEWAHFSYAGIDRLAASSIPNDVPYICLVCNDNVLYTDKTSGSEMNQDGQVTANLGSCLSTNISVQNSQSIINTDCTLNTEQSQVKQDSVNINEQDCECK